MDLSTIPLFEKLNRKMDWLSRNHTVLSQNIANSDTPGYQAHELEKLDFKRRLEMMSTDRVPVRLTHANHITGSDNDGPWKSRARKEPYEVTPTGNAVSLEEQAVLAAKNSMDYQLATTLYGKSLNMMRLALGRRS